MPEKLMLVVSELAEALEALRNGLVTPTSGKGNFYEEIADTFIRLLDIANAIGMDIDEEISKKMEVNWTRVHKHGKVF